MTWQEVSNLFNAIANGLSLSYEEGTADHINMVFQGVDKYPLCYALPASLLSTGAGTGPEPFVYRIWEGQIAFIDIDSTFATAPDMQNLDRTQLRSAMIEQAETFVFNLYESNLIPGDLVIESWKVDQLTMNVSGDAAFGALLSYKISTLSDLDCTNIVNG